VIDLLIIFHKLLRSTTLKNALFPRLKQVDDTKNTWIWWVLGLHVLAWVVAHGIADTNLDSYADMLENYAWGQELTWGSAKHPPLFAWVTSIWFFLFPTIDTAYHVLSYLNVAIGLLGVYRLAQAMERSDLALPAVVLLCMAFPYSTLAVKFNANAILLSVWPWVAVAWVQSIRTSGRAGLIWSAALGVLAALAMLGKYYSGVFLLTLFLAALASNASRLWFITPKPWLTLLVFALTLLPHLYWLQGHDFVTLHYVSEQGTEDGVNWRLLSKFAVSPIGYWLVPWLLCTVLYAPKATSVWQTLRSWPARMWRSWCPIGWGDSLFWFAMLPWAITLMFGITEFVELSLPWAIPIGYGFSLLWLRNLTQDKETTTLATQRLLKCLMAWFAVVVLVSPWYAWHQAQDGTENHYLPRREAAAALLQTWHARHPEIQLEWVGGQWAESALLAFYGDHTLRVVPEVPDQFPATVSPLLNWQSRAGLLLCPMGPVSAPLTTDCPERMQAWLKSHGQNTTPLQITVTSQGMRFPLDKPFAYTAFEYLPKQPE
jgi:4-amino-4-deoxy-L-arabinose transferase-like glycosyltransferase